MEAVVIGEAAKVSIIPLIISLEALTNDERNDGSNLREEKSTKS